MQTNRISTKKEFNENGYNVAIATLDKKNPDVFFVEGSFYVRPVEGRPCDEDFVPMRKRYAYVVRQITRGDTIKVFNTAMGKYDRADKVYVRYQYYIRNTENLSFGEIADNYDIYVLPVVAAMKQSIIENGYKLVERRKGLKKASE